jgi:hypothetical protein
MPGEVTHTSHYWKSDFVGEQTFLELTENHYRTS